VDGVTPLDQFTLDNRGLDPTPLGLVMTGLGAAGGEFVPMLANLSTGEALVFLGRLPAGKRLFLLPVESEDGPVLSARLEREDVSDKIRFIDPLRPGDASSAVAAAGPARPLTLARGENLMWFLPLAHYDLPGLDRVLLALAEENLRQGKWDETLFDQSVFAQGAQASLQLGWAESTPATIELRLPTGIMRSEAGEIDAALEARENLATALQIALRQLSAAGVEARSKLAPWHEHQPMHDNLRFVVPTTFREGGSVGADSLPDSDGRFGVTGLDDSTLG
jgi:hypothetical protein